MQKKILHKVLLLLLGLTSLGLIAFCPNHALAANPTTVNFQGKVVNSDGTNVANGNYSVVFRIYSGVTSSYDPNSFATCAADTNCYWEETQATVPVTNGVFQVELGSVCSFSSACNSSHSGINFSTQNSLYLTMKFGSDTQFMKNPLIHFNSIPYAFYADNAGSLGGIASSGFIQLAPNAVQTDTNTSNVSIFVNKNNASGTPNILELQKSSADVLVVSNNGSFTVTPQAAAGTVTLGSTTQTGQITVGQSTASNIISIGAAAGNLATQTINIGTSVTAGSTTNVVVGSTVAGSTTIQSSGGLVLGKSSAGGVNGKLVFDNTAGTNTVSLIAQSSNPASSVNLFLPTVGASGTQCLSTTSGSTSTSTTLQFGACGGSFATTYSTTSQANNTITYSSSGGAGLIIQDATTPLTGNLLTVQNNGATFQFLSLNLATSVPHLKVYAGNDNTKYADIYYDATNGAVFAASVGTTTIGTTSGPITISAGSSSPVTITADAASGFTTTTGALTLTGAAASTWSTTAGLLTVQGAGGLSLISTGVTAISVDSGTTGDVDIGATNATNAKAVSVGNTNAGSSLVLEAGTSTLQIGNGATAHNIQIGTGAAAQTISIGSTNGASSLTLQGGSGDITLLTSTGNVIQIGSSTTDANITLLVVDSYNGATDPTGVNGGIYYDTGLTNNANHLRCYQNGIWSNCVNGSPYSVMSVQGAATTAATKSAAATIMIVPIYIPGQITVNQIHINVVTTALGAAGDVGLYNSSGVLVLNGGSSSLTTAIGAKTITPTQTGSARILEPGQYYAAVTWNSTTGSVSAAALPSSGLVPRVGTITGGGLVLPSSITLSSITAAANMPAISFNN